jgi:hypothetical protein
VCRRSQRARHHPQLAHLPRSRQPPPTHRISPCNRHLYY